MTTYRWYTLGLKTPFSPVPAEVRSVAGMTYEITGWSRTEDAALAKRDQLDLAGRQGINIYAASRQQAARDAVEVYGVKVEGYISPEDKRAGRAIVKAAVMRAIFCPYTERILDMRRAVVVDTGTRSFVMSAAHWDKINEAHPDLRAELEARNNGRAITVYDGRELFR